MTGSDVNIIDQNGMTPCSLWSKEKSVSHLFHEIQELFYNYLKQLKVANLFIHDQNKILCMTCRTNESDSNDLFLNEFKLMKEQKIFNQYTIQSLLTENLVKKIVVLPDHIQNKIISCLRDDELHKNYQNWSPFFNLQYRKIINRLDSCKFTIDDLRTVLDPRLPLHALESIMFELNNEDCINLSKAIHLKNN